MWAVSITCTVTLLLLSAYIRESFLTVSDACALCMCTRGAVNCSYRNLHQVPDDLPASAVSLNLSHNLLHYLPDNVFHNLTSLAVLDLSYNYLSNFTPSVFVGLRNLQWLSVTWNNLSLSDKTYPFGVFSPFSKTLLYLYLNGNSPPNQPLSQDFSYPDKALSELTSLVALFIDGLGNTRLGSGFGHLQNLTNLSFVGSPDGFCNLVKLKNETFIHHSPSLKYLNLSYCNICCIEADAFTPLRTLQILDLSHNEDLGTQGLGLAVYGLQGSALHTLYINHINSPYALCVFISKADTVYFKNTSITSIYAKHNNLQFFSEGALLNMPDSLEFVSLDGNHLVFGRYLQELNNLKSLKEIQADGYNHPLDTPTHYPAIGGKYIGAPSCVGGPSLCKKAPEHFRWSVISDMRRENSWIPVLGYDVTNTTADNSTYFVLPPDLTDFRSRQNQIFYQVMQIAFDPNNALRKMDLSSNFLVKLIGPVTGLEKLQYLDLSNNVAADISDTFFRNFTSLRILHLQKNVLHYLNESNQDSIFAPLLNLELLDLSFNYLYTLPTTMLTGLANLKMINFSYNYMISFDVDISSARRLKLLDLAYNNIHSLPSHVRAHLDSVAQTASENVTVNLTFNSIFCACENIEFLSWMAHTKVHFPHKKLYFCLMSDGTVQHLVDIFEVIADLQQQCSNFSSILIGAVSCFFCLILSLVSALMYRFRWKLRYWYYASRMSYRRSQSQEARQFDYDAFVSYASDDKDFVRGQLVHNLEVQENLRLNLHDRDFMPGQPIPCNIMAAVQNSRRTLVVLTRHLLQSDWCQYEMQMATMEAVHTGRDVLVFLLYEDIPSHELPRQVLYNLQSTSYMLYPHDDPTLLPTFWARLARAVRM